MANDLPRLSAKHPVISELLFKRGFTNATLVSGFLDARVGHLSPLETWPGIIDAAKRIASFVHNGGKTAIWGDYDCDGVTATAIMLEVFRAHKIDVLYHLPDRFKEGYGMNINGVEELAKAGVKLLITVDNGIMAHEAVSHAKKLGMRVIVTDHHLKAEGIPFPPADIVLDMHYVPDGTVTPDPNLCGAGLSFFLAGAINQELHKLDGFSFKMDRVLDLAGLGTIADVVPLRGQNRLLARACIDRLHSTHRPGLRAILEYEKIAHELHLTGENIGFKVTPYINAAGRLEHANLALEMLLADGDEALKKAEQLHMLNFTRKQLTENMEKEALRMTIPQKNDGGVIAFNAEWHEGILGIVAGRLSERFCVPAIVFTQKGEVFKGSARSPQGINLYDILNDCEDLVKFGGHESAAGVSVKQNDFKDFSVAFKKSCTSRIVNLDVLAFQPDADLDIFSLSEKERLNVVQDLYKLEPFGEGNPMPVFRASGPIYCKKVWKKESSLTYGNVLLSKDNTDIWFKVWRSIDEWRENEVLPYIDFKIAYAWKKPEETIERIACTVEENLRRRITQD